MPSPAIERILSGLRQPPVMSERRHIDSKALIVEVMRYLAAVDAFRTENCEPMWLPELVSIRAAECQPSSLDASSLASGKHLH
jgi:hypothetical protein